ncbi:MAG: hypothetical protein L0Z52_10160, partial [Acidobacteria bacterium]|nr:hypothetical protein [Acidobacteriota bacterium]
MLCRTVASKLAHVAILTFTGAGILALFPSSASAISAWSRKYDVPCSTCHFPAPPRLNVYGEKFRRAGFRTAEEFNKDVDWKSVSNY